MLKHVMHMSRNDVAKTLIVEPTAIISLTDPAYPDAVFPDVPSIRLKVHDVIPGGRHAVVFDGTPLDQLTPFDEAMADKILDFLDDIHDKVSLIIVHCEGGISRSAGVGKFIAERYDLPCRVHYDNYQMHNQHIFKTLWRADIRRCAGL
jgi:predicted protein tyrosine phosphatase